MIKEDLDRWVTHTHGWENGQSSDQQECLLKWLQILINCIQMNYRASRNITLLLLLFSTIENHMNTVVLSLQSRSKENKTNSVFHEIRWDHLRAFDEGNNKSYVLFDVEIVDGFLY